MNWTGWVRALMTSAAAGVAGFLLWLAAQFDLGTTGGYWAAFGIVAGSGLLLGLVALRGYDGNPAAMLVLAFLPVLVCAGWVLLYAQPEANWFREHVRAWSGDIGVADVTNDVSTFVGVLAFGTGLVLAYTLEPARRRTAATVVVDETHAMGRRPIPGVGLAADAPTAAEREDTVVRTDRPPAPADTDRTTAVR
jgi:hypothetical protein